MNTDEILEIMYRIQGFSDPNGNTEMMTERMTEIFELASDVMRRTGYHPDGDVE